MELCENTMHLLKKHEGKGFLNAYFPIIPFFELILNELIIDLRHINQQIHK